MSQIGKANIEPIDAVSAYYGLPTYILYIYKKLVTIKVSVHLDAIGAATGRAIACTSGIDDIHVVTELASICYWTLNLPLKRHYVKYKFGT